MSALAGLARVVTKPILEHEILLQHQLGYKLKLVGTPKGWINSFMLADMTKTWRAAGLGVHGLNFFTFGAIEDSTSTRFVPGHRMYQAWLGGYVVGLNTYRRWDDEEYFKLAEADQNKWLRHFGDPSPVMNFSQAGKATEIADLSHPATLLSWAGTTHADVGKRSRRIYTRALMSGMASMMNQLNPSLNLTGSQFVPAHRPTQTYAPTDLAGYLLIYDIQPRLKAIVYACGTGALAEDKAILKSLVTEAVALEQTGPYA